MYSMWGPRVKKNITSTNPYKPPFSPDPGKLKRHCSKVLAPLETFRASSSRNLPGLLSPGPQGMAASLKKHRLSPASVIVTAGAHSSVIKCRGVSNLQRTANGQILERVSTCFAHLISAGLCSTHHHTHIRDYTFKGHLYIGL